MLRTFVCATLALLIGAGMGLAADKGNKKGKKGHGAFGTIKSINGNNLTVTVKNRKTGDETDKEFKLDDDTKVIVFAGKDKKEMDLKEGLKAPELKKGAKVRVRLNEDGKVLAVAVGDFPARKPGKKPEKSSDK